MGLESTTTIAGLDKTWPSSGDPRSQGDDHLRLIKDVLKTTFPGSGGNGFSIPITATEGELNFVAGATSNLQAQISALVNAHAGFIVRKSANQLNFPVGGAFFQVLWQTIEYDNKTGFAANKYTVPVGQGGLWFLSASISNNGNNTDWTMQIRKNGGTMQQVQQGGVFNMGNILNCNIAFIALDGDTFEVYAQCIAGTNNDLIANSATNFFGFRVY